MFGHADKPRRDTAPRLAGSLNGHLTRMRQLKRLANQGVPAREAAVALKMHPFYGEKVYRQAEAFSDEELASATIRFADLDLALKGGSRLAPDVELLRALIDVSAAPTAAEDEGRPESRGDSQHSGGSTWWVEVTARIPSISEQCRGHVSRLGSDQ